MLAYIYCRFSSSSQRELSIDGQRAICQEYAEKHGIEIAGEYVDRARSGRTENRANFRRLMRDASTGAVGCVLVWRYDRFFRNRAESALYRLQLEKAGVRLISVTEFIPDGSAGIITQGMIETVAEYFSAKLSEDVARGMHQAALRCQVTCAPAFGYQAGADKKWKVNPVEAEAVRRIFEWYVAGLPMKDLAAQLNQEGFRTHRGHEFRKGTLLQILQNEKYIGVYKYGDSVRIEGGVPRLIEDELFFAAQRRRQANQHRPGAYKAEQEYLLSGKLFCGTCGSPMTGISGTGRNGVRHYYYRCARHVGRDGCPRKNVRLDLIEDAVLSQTLALLTDENIAYIAAEVERHSATESDSAALLASLKAQLAEVQGQIKNIGKAISAGIITETTKELLEAAEADRAALRLQIEKATAQAALVVKAENVACWLDGFRHRRKDDPDFRREVFGALVSAIYVYDDNLKIIFNIDEYGAVVVPFSAVDSVQPAGPAGSYLGQFGAPLPANPNPLPYKSGFGFVFAINRIR